MQIESERLSVFSNYKLTSSLNKYRVEMQFFMIIITLIYLKKKQI